MEFFHNLQSEGKYLSNNLIMAMDQLAGNFIVATPTHNEEDYFNRTLIFIISHDNNGSVGVVLNKYISNITSSLVFKSLGIEYNQSKNYEPVYSGGPVDTEKGIVLHSIDYIKNSMLVSGKKLAVSSNVEILKDIAECKGPKKSKLFLGYSGWNKGQLEEEILAGEWYTLPYSPDLFFSADDYSKYDLALNKIGINKAFLSPGNSNFNLM